MAQFMIRNESKSYDFVYDQLVSFAEFLSTKIVSYYLNEIGIDNSWLDVRNAIKTNSDFRDAKVDWAVTEQQILKNVQPHKLYITQGFLGKNENQKTTTLGREGSDYTAGIFAYCLDAESVTIWKDVEGVLNADPRYFNDTDLLEQISYTEAIELAFYGASVIHPKTLQPLQKKDIPLRVKSFVNPKNDGTKVSRGVQIFPETPCFIVKKDQILLSISSLDFSFIVERNISEIFNLLHEYKMKVNLIQNSAISFSVCLEDKHKKFDGLLDELKDKFKIDFHKEVTLYTIRHFTEEAIKKIEKDNKLLLKQLTQETVQIVIE
jgi:aspartate kinase